MSESVGNMSEIVTVAVSGLSCTLISSCSVTIESLAMNSSSSSKSSSEKMGTRTVWLATSPLNSSSTDVLLKSLEAGERERERECVRIVCCVKLPSPYPEQQRENR